MIIPIFVRLMRNHTPAKMTIVTATKKTSLYTGNSKLPSVTDPLRYEGNPG